MGWSLQEEDSVQVLQRKGARVVITIEPTTGAQATVRLREMAAEWPGPVATLTMAGWPAIQRSRQAATPSTGAVDPVASFVLTHVTTAVAAGSRLIRLEATLSDPSLLDEVQQISRTFPLGAVRALGRATPSARMAMLPPVSTNISQAPGSSAPVVSPATGGPSTGFNSRVNNNANTNSETEVAVSADGQHIVIVNNTRDYVTSNDFGTTFTQRFNNAGAGVDQGDPSVSFGASGAFYTAHIRQPNGTAAAGNVSGCATEITRSTDNGVTFTLQGYSALSPVSGIGVFFPDQEHIATDRVNQASNLDQVYSTWRDFRPVTPAAGDACASFTGLVPVTVSPRLVCSTDGGANWGTSVVVGTGDFPRITVGQDGFVYVVYASGTTLMINKYSSCANGLTQQTGFPRTITSSFAGVNCSVSTAPAGLDRCNGNNILGGPTVAVDDTNANHIYVAYANTSAAGNENVIVQDSTDGGTTWTRPAVTVNTSPTAHRFMPWVCAAGGTAFVSWYDTRFAVAGTSDDATDFFGGSATLDSGGNLIASSELRISQVSDPMCATNWPVAANNRTSPEACPTQPQLAGSCSVTTATPCDFSDCAGGGGTPPCQCPAGETCNPGRGFPKYGDYNGSACAIGRFYATWASATSPPGMIPPSSDIDVFFACPPTPGLQSLSFTDTTPPFFTAPPAPVAANSCVGASLGNVQARDICGTAAPVLTNDAPSVFPTGLTNVTWTATDAAGNVATAAQAVTVTDLTPPVFTFVPGPITVNNCGPVPLGGPAVAVDDCTGGVMIRNDAPASFPRGATIVTWTATDAAGNVSTATQTITVQDTTPPMFILVPPAITITTCVAANIGVPVATDACGPVTITSNAPAKFPLGTTIVTWTARDLDGNTRTATQTVTAQLGDDTSCCPDGTRIIVGTSGRDILVGTSGNDCILGRNGDDVIDARGGNDAVSGGAGNDTIAAGPGNDRVYGGNGNDTIHGGTGNDFIDGGPGIDTCATGIGTNTILACEVR